MEYKNTIHKIHYKCLVCNTDKEFLEEEVTANCDLCTQEFEADSVCENNHYVCHTCRQKAAREEIIRHCLVSKHIDPYILMLELMKLPGVAMHGPEHHLLLTASLLTALCNTKERNDFAFLLEEANKRSMQVPGGACGNWGICGAAIGAGIFSSLISESSPYAENEWKSCGQLTAKCANSISRQGDPRCCKRDSYTAFIETVNDCNKHFGTDFVVPDLIECQFYINNKECKGKRCRFFPKPKAR